MKRLIPISLVTLVLVSACNMLPAQQPAQQPQTTQPAETAETMPTGVDAQDTPLVIEGEIDPNVSRYGTNLNCEMLKDENSRTTCEVQINDMIGSLLETEIVTTFDIARCDELPAQVAAVCTEQITETGVKGPVSTDEMNLFAEITAGTFPEPDESGIFALYPIYDSGRCSELKTEGLKEYCVKQIAMAENQLELDKIFQSGDVEGCDTLTDEALKTNCQAFFGVGLDAPPVDIEIPVPDDIVPVEEPVEVPADLSGAAPEEEPLVDQPAVLEINEDDIVDSTE